MEEKINTAVEFLKENRSCTIGDIRLGVENNTLTVTGWSLFSNIDSLTREQALKELSEIKRLFMRMVEVSPELRNFVADKNTVYHLYFDDYSKSSVVICSEKNEMVKWEMELK